MWSVKCCPNPGFAWISSSRARSTGVGLAVVLICMGSTYSRGPEGRSETGGDGVPDLARTTARAGVALGEVGQDGRLDRGGRLGVAEVVEQERAGEDRGGRVGLLLPGDVGGSRGRARTWTGPSGRG